MDSRRYFSPRLLPSAGYSDDPGPIPFISKSIVPGSRAKVVRDVTISGRRFEVWSPNSRRLPFYPGIKVPGVDLEELARSKKRYDGHLGPLDPTMHPQHYQIRRPYLPFIRRHSHLNPPNLYPEFVSLFDTNEAWIPDSHARDGSGWIPEAYITRLRTRNRKLLEEMSSLRPELYAASDDASLRLLWTQRPLLPAEHNLVDLKIIRSFETAVDEITEIQRGLKHRDAWIRYVRLKLSPFQATDLACAFLLDADEQYMGLWMSDEVYDDSLLYLSRAAVACFFIHEYTTEESQYHHRTHTPYPDAQMQNYSLLFAPNNPCYAIIQLSNLRGLELKTGESVGRIQASVSYAPGQGSLSLSNRQGYREPSLRAADDLPASLPLFELVKRPITPVKLWSNTDGLETDVGPLRPYAASVKSKKREWARWCSIVTMHKEKFIVQMKEDQNELLGQRTTWFDRQFRRELLLELDEVPEDAEERAELGRPAPRVLYFLLYGEGLRSAQPSRRIHRTRSPEVKEDSPVRPPVHVAVTSAKSAPSIEIRSKGKQKEVSPASSFNSILDEHPYPTTSSAELPETLVPRRQPLVSISSSKSLPLSAVVVNEPSERSKELYGAYQGVHSEFWRIDSLPSRGRSSQGLLTLLRETSKKIPIAVSQILRTWEGEREVYWLRFESRDQALRARGYLAASHLHASDGCDGPLVEESVYQLAIEEVRHPEARPLSPSTFWSLPVAMDPRFQNAEITPPHTHASSYGEPLSSTAEEHEDRRNRRYSATSQHKSITPKYQGETRAPSSPPMAAPAPKRTRINSPPRRFLVSHPARIQREVIPLRTPRRAKPLVERLALSPPNERGSDTLDETHSATTRPKGPESRARHNLHRYHKK